MTASDIKNLRQNLGLSQQQFALLVGSSIKTISNWENGAKIPASKIPQLEALASGASLRATTVQTATGAHATQIAGDHTLVEGCASSALDKALDEIAAQRRLVENAQVQTTVALAQVNRLITLLEIKLGNG